MKHSAPGKVEVKHYEERQGPDKEKNYKKSYVEVQPKASPEKQKKHVLFEEEDKNDKTLNDRDMNFQKTDHYMTIIKDGEVTDYPEFSTRKNSVNTNVKSEPNPLYGKDYQPEPKNFDEYEN